MSGEQERYVTVEGCVSCDMNGEKVVLNTASGIYFGLDGVGTRVWELLAGPHSLDELLDSLFDDYDVEKDVLKNDVAAFVGKLHEHGLISTVDKTTPEDNKTES